YGHAHIKGSQLVTLEGCGHTVQMDCFEEYNRAVLSFLGSLPAPAPAAPPATPEPPRPPEPATPPPPEPEQPAPPTPPTPPSGGPQGRSKAHPAGAGAGAKAGATRTASPAAR